MDQIASLALGRSALSVLASPSFYFSSLDLANLPLARHGRDATKSVGRRFRQMRDKQSGKIWGGSLYRRRLAEHFGPERRQGLYRAALTH